MRTEYWEDGRHIVSISNLQSVFCEIKFTMNEILYLVSNFYRSSYRVKKVGIKYIVICSVLLSNFIVSIAASSPAVENDRASYISIEQANGSVIVVKSQGDARFHWLENKAGKVIIKNTITGNFEYATIAGERGKSYLVPSGIEVMPISTLQGGETGNSSLTGGEQKEFVPLTSKDLLPLRKSAFKKHLNHKPSVNGESR